MKRVLERFGFVRIKDYGLVLTPDRRVVTTRKILDDGFGSHVVGYVSGDLAAMELAPKDSTERPAPIPEPPLAFAPTVAMPFVPPPKKPVATTQPAPAPVVTTPVVAIAPEPPPIAPVDEPEDEWEWEIAAARAAAEKTPTVAEPEEDWEWQIAAARARAEATNHFEAPRAPIVPKSTPVAAVAPWREDTAVRSVTQLAKMSEQVHSPTPPRTIIPVPTYQPATTARLMPVRAFDSSDTRQIPMPRRFPKATQPPQCPPGGAMNDEDTAVRRVARR